MDRVANYSVLAAKLAQFSDEELAELLAQSPQMHAGVGGRSVLLTLESTPIFVKKIPLTDVERRPDHQRSTANLFDIPLSCHYGLGGPGFNAWRELAAVQAASEWVRLDACANFPLLYHWRVLPSVGRGFSPGMFEPPAASVPHEPEGDVDFWSAWPAVRYRLEAIRHATAQVALFLEYVPQTLLHWLRTQVTVSGEAAASAIAFVDARLWPTIDFMHARGLTHFDVHFENITTDGERFCVGDFGLALSAAFELTSEEIEFAAHHQRYDQGRAAFAYVHCLTSAFFGSERWPENFRALLKSAPSSSPPAVVGTLQQHAPLALAFLDFSRRLQYEDKHARYPADL
jgi:hypothetical protein